MALLIIGTIALIIFYFCYRSSLSPVNTGFTKQHLFNSVCIMNDDTLIEVNYPINLVGKPDQAMQLPNKEVFVLDTKKRKNPRVYLSDKIQLTAYSYILKNNGYKVLPFGVIRIPTTGNEAKYFPIDLLPDEELYRLYHRYLEIKNGQITPICTCGNH